jgi:hypothetical protein
MIVQYTLQSACSDEKRCCYCRHDSTVETNDHAIYEGRGTLRKSPQSQGYQPLNEIQQTSQLAFCVWVAPNTYRENECKHVFCSWIPVPAVKLWQIYSQFVPWTNQFIVHTRLLIVIRQFTGRFIMFSVITNIYNKKTKRPTLMELFSTSLTP